MQAFVTAVGSDERSYKLELFNDAARILRRDAMIPEQGIHMKREREEEERERERRRRED